MRLVARHRLTWQGSTVEPGTALEARGAAQEKRLYGLWLRRAAITESAWQQATLNRRKKAEKESAAVAETAPVAEPPPRRGVSCESNRQASLTEAVDHSEGKKPRRARRARGP